jgi:hypothetical protein
MPLYHYLAIGCWYQQGSGTVAMFAYPCSVTASVIGRLVHDEMDDVCADLEAPSWQPYGNILISLNADSCESKVGFKWKNDRSVSIMRII